MELLRELVSGSETRWAPPRGPEGRGWADACLPGARRRGSPCRRVLAPACPDAARWEDTRPTAFPWTRWAQAAERCSPALPCVLSEKGNGTATGETLGQVLLKWAPERARPGKRSDVRSKAEMLRTLLNSTSSFLKGNRVCD